MYGVKQKPVTSKYQPSHLPGASRLCHCWMNALLRSYCCASGLFSGDFLIRFQTERFFFYQALDSFRTDTLGCLLLNKIGHLCHISRMLFKILLGLTLFFFCKL